MPGWSTATGFDPCAEPRTAQAFDVAASSSRVSMPKRNSTPSARLEWLDDLMFAAIDGDPVALDYAADAWHKTRDELGDAALEESRLQYMRHAQTVWHSLRGQPNHPPHKVFAAIEIISLLAGRRGNAVRSVRSACLPRFED